MESVCPVCGKTYIHGERCPGVCAVCVKTPEGGKIYVDNMDTGSAINEELWRQAAEAASEARIPDLLRLHAAHKAIEAARSHCDDVCNERGCDSLEKCKCKLCKAIKAYDEAMSQKS